MWQGDWVTCSGTHTALPLLHPAAHRQRHGEPRKLLLGGHRDRQPHRHQRPLPRVPAERIRAECDGEQPRGHHHCPKHHGQAPGRAGHGASPGQGTAGAGHQQGPRCGEKVAAGLGDPALFRDTFLGCSPPMASAPGPSPPQGLMEILMMLSPLVQAYDPDSGAYGQITYQLLPDTMYVGTRTGGVHGVLPARGWSPGDGSVCATASQPSR